MADNVEITAGSGTTIKTDDVGSGVQVQYVKLMDGTDAGTGVIPGDATNGLDVDVTRLPSLPAGTANIGDVDVASIAAGDNNIGNVDVVTLPALAAGSNNIGDVDVLSIAAGDNNIGNVDIVSMPALPTGSNTIGTVKAIGTVANGSAASDAPVLVAGIADGSIDDMTLEDDGDVVTQSHDLDRVQVIKEYCPYGDILNERVSNTDGNSTALTVFGATANTRNYITTLVAFNVNTTTSGFLDIRDGSSGSVLFSVPLPAGGGVVINFTVPLRQPTVNTALAYDVSAAITTVYISLIGFKSKV